MSLDLLLTSPALAGMRQLRQWMIYVAAPDPGKPGKLTKLPLHHATGAPSSVVEPANWTDVETAAAAVRRFGDGFGLAFCFTEDDPYWFVDLDGCLQADGSWSPLAIEIVTQTLAGAACEISASGKGLHMFGRGVVPPHASKNIEQHAELYTGSRFCAMTGTALQGDCDRDFTVGISKVVAAYFAPKNRGVVDLPDVGPVAEWRGPTDDAELLRRAMRSQSAGAVFGGKASFADLWHRDLTVLARSYPGDGEGGTDWSSVDAALAQMLCFWTGKDQARMVRLMQQSNLRRAKWDDREDYLPRTVLNACNMQREVLIDKPVVPPPTGPGAPPPPAGPGAPPAPALTLTAGAVAAPASSAPGGRMEARATAAFLSPADAAVLFDGCFYVADLHRVLVKGGTLYKPDNFKSFFGGRTFVLDAQNIKTTRNAFEAFTENQVMAAPIVDGTCFRPTLPYGTIVTSEGRRRANSFWPAEVYRTPGDVSRFLKHLALLLPNENDRRYFLYWMANAVQRPGHKSQWMPLLVGAEGNGKSLFSRCLAYAVGNRYTHWPDASKLGGSFNGWMHAKLLICIEDLNIGDSAEVWEKLKPMITGESLEIEQKGIDQRTDEVCANFIANSNHRNAIRATINDRRVCHLWCAQQSAADVIRDGLNEAYMSSMYDWLKNEGGYAVVADYLFTLEIPEEFGLRWFKGRAPKTSSANAAVEASLGPIEQEVLEAVERGDSGFCGDWISSGAFEHLLEKLNRTRVVAPNKRREILQGLGYDWHPGLPHGRVNNEVLPDGAKVKLFIKAGSASLAFTRDARPAEIAAAYTAAQAAALPGR